MAKNNSILNRFGKKSNSPFSVFQLLILGALIVGLFVALVLVSRPSILFPSAAQIGPLNIVPKSGNWNYPDKFVITNTQKYPITLKWFIECFDTNYCKNTEGTVALGASGSSTSRVELGAGKICAKWQLDLDWTGDGIDDWGGVAEKENECGTPQACKVGYMFAQKRISDGVAYSAFLSKDQLQSARPDLQIEVFDLYKDNNPVTSDKLGALKALFVSDGAYVTPTGSMTAVVPANERITSAEVSAVSQAYNKGLDVVVLGDNGKADGTSSQDAASLAIPVTNGLQKAIVYGPAAWSITERTGTLGSVAPMWGSVVPFLSGATYDTRTSGLRTPGYLTKGPDADSTGSSCMVPVYTSQGWLITCLVGYVPPSGTRGMLVVDGNAGVPTRSHLVSILNEVCK